jgi:cell division protein FtsQ
MAGNYKISARKVMQVIFTLLVTAGCVTAIVAAGLKDDKSCLKAVSIQIKNAQKYHFVEQTEIMNKLFTDRQIDALHTPCNQLDIRKMELLLVADPWIADAEVFIDNNKVLNVFVTQRIPVARLFCQNTVNCYMDETTHTMPVSPKICYFTNVVTNVPELKDDTASLVLKKKILAMVTAVQADSFWSAQVSEIVIDSAGNLNLIPVLGNQTILIGDTTRLKDKLDNLLVFYRKVLNRIGWDKYDLLDVRFAGQVVASPKLPYEGPKDNAAQNWNWVTTMVDSESVADTEDTLVKQMKPVAAATATEKKTEAGKEKHGDKKDADKNADKVVKNEKNKKDKKNKRDNKNKDNIKAKKQ